MPLLLIKIHEDKVSAINIIEKNDYYSHYYGDLFAVQEEQESYYHLKLYGKTGTLIDAFPFPESFVYAIPLETTRIEITNAKTSKAIFDEKINICNHNHLCESKDLYPESYESSLTCSDCQQSAKDNYCEIIHDDVCDPDCNNLEYECDPAIVTKKDSLLDNNEFQCKEQFNGNLCKETEECLTTSIVINSRICCEGPCSEKFLLKNELNKLTVSSTATREIYLGKQIKKEPTNNLRLLWVGVISVMIIITLIVIFVIKQQQKNKKLFVEVNELINQYNYDQIKKILRKKGYDEKTITKAINLHYTKYKSYYEQQFNQLEKNK